MGGREEGKKINEKVDGRRGRTRRRERKNRRAGRWNEGIGEGSR